MSITLTTKGVLTAVQVASTACSVIGKTWTEYQEWRQERKAAKAKARSEARAAALQRRRVAEALWVEQYNEDNAKRAGKGRRGK